MCKEDEKMKKRIGRGRRLGGERRVLEQVERGSEEEEDRKWKSR